MSDVISLMMVTYNRLELTKQTIENINNKSNGVKFNFIIFDNGSTDGTVEFLKELEGKEGYYIRYNKENLGIGRGRNQCLAFADKLNTDWYVTIDNDVDLPFDWLNRCINMLKANKNYGALGINFEETQYPIVDKNGHKIQDKERGNLGTACMVFKKSLHKIIGFFKEYNKYGLEDADFGIRARVSGFKMGYLDESGVHLGSGSYDIGEYRAFKTEQHDSRVDEFKNNCNLYIKNMLPLYVPFKYELV